MKLTRTSKGLSLNRLAAIEKMLKKCIYFDYKSISIPYDSSAHLKNLGEHVYQLKYAQIIGSLLYITNGTRLHTAYAVDRLRR